PCTTPFRARRAMSRPCERVPGRLMQVAGAQRQRRTRSRGRKVNLAPFLRPGTSLAVTSVAPTPSMPGEARVQSTRGEKGAWMGLEIFLIDYENVQPTGVGRLVPGTCRIMLFLGEKQNKEPVELTRALHPFGADVEYLSISGNGPNAVDFHIAFYIGQLAQKRPGAKFTIVSRDTGFDPLVRHLSDTLKIGCSRIEALPAHAASKVVAAAPSVPAVAGGQGTVPASTQAAATAPAVHPAGGNVVTLKPAAVAAVAQPVAAVSSAVPVV